MKFCTQKCKAKVDSRTESKGIVKKRKSDVFDNAHQLPPLQQLTFCFPIIHHPVIMAKNHGSLPKGHTKPPVSSKV